MNIFKLLVLIAFLAIGSLNSKADDDPIYIDLKPVVPPNNPNKPKAPSQVRISAYYDGCAVVLTSTVATMADVEISDTESGTYCFNGLTALAPDFRCLITAAPGSTIMITVSVGSTVYEGVLML